LSTENIKADKKIPEIRLSPTGVQSFFNCRRRWQLEQKWRPLRDSFAPTLGSIIHLGLSCRVLREDWPSICVAALNRTDLKPEDKAKAWALAEPLVKHWNPPDEWLFLSVEDKFELPVPSESDAVLQKVTWSGYIDAEIWKDDELWVVDYKTSQRTPDPDHAMIDEQLLAYYATEKWKLTRKEIDQTPRGSIWAAIVIPGLRLKKGESWNEFHQRVDNAVQAEPFKHYQNFPLEYTDDQVDYFWEKVRYVVNEIREKRFYKNPGHCKYLPCQFRDICLNDTNAKIMGFKPKEQEERPSLDILMAEGVLQGLDAPVSPDDLADETVKWERVNVGMSQEEIAEKLGVSKKAIASWEDMEKFPEDEEMRKKIREALSGEGS